MRERRGKGEKRGLERERRGKGERRQVTISKLPWHSKRKLAPIIQQPVSSHNDSAQKTEPTLIEIERKLHPKTRETIRGRLAIPSTSTKRGKRDHRERAS